MVDLENKIKPTHLLVVLLDLVDLVVEEMVVVVVVILTHRHNKKDRETHLL